MDLRQLEEAIQLAQSPGPRKAEASRYLDELRSSSESWKAGMGLFFESTNDVARHFGLSLTREYLASHGTNDVLQCQVRAQIREALMSWTATAVAANMSIQVYLVNNIVGIITLLIKSDYPEIWSDAFGDILRLGAQNIVGLDILVRVLDELEIEVVENNRVFDENPDRQSVLVHNTLIKDTMRSTSTISDIVDFLCQAVASGRQIQSGALSDRILRCLANLVSWIDVNLIIKESTLRIIYQSLDDTRLSAAACVCLHELAKKGMDPVTKVVTLHGIGLAQVLARHVPPPVYATRDDEGCEEEFGELVTMVFLELLGCWSKFEESVGLNPDGNSVHFTFAGVDLKPSISSPPGSPLAKSIVAPPPSPSEGPALLETMPIVVGYLRDYWGMLMAVFAHEDSGVAATVVPALNRLLALLKFQLGMRPEVAAAAARSLPGGIYFSAREFMHPLLLGIFKQMQFSEDFDFDASDEDESEVVEAKKEIRKLFVNTCRVVPELCLQLIAAILPSIPQPMSRAPFPQLDAVLRLMYSFGECGQQNKALVKEGTFPALLAALHQTDVASHPHDQVVLGYYEVAVRYCKQMDVGGVQAVVARMVGDRGVRHTSGHVRARSAYFLLKMAEAMEGKASLLLPSVTSFSDLLLTEVGVASPLGEAAELHLLEAVGLMTSSTHQCGEKELQQQQQIVQEVVGVLIQQIQTLLSHPQLQRYGDQMGEAVAHRVSSLTSFTKGYNMKTQPQIVGVIHAAGAVVVSAVQALAQHPAVRSKVVTFCHRCLAVAGSAAVDITLSVLPVLIEKTETADCEHTVQLLSNLLVDFKGACVTQMDAFYRPMLGKIGALRVQFEQHQREGGGGETDLAHVEMERVGLQKHYLIFLQHLVAQGCSACLISETNISLLDEVLQQVLVGLQGGDGTHLPGGMEGRLILRKTALLIFSGLAVAWMTPSEGLSPQLTTALSALLYDRALPMALSMCSDGRTLNVHDAGTQGVVSEVACLLWTLHALRPADTLGHLQTSLLPTLGWPPACSTALLEMLAAGTPQGTFKENFKRFLRSSWRR